MKETFLKIVKVLVGNPTTNEIKHTEVIVGYPNTTEIKKEKTFIELFREFNERDALQNNLKEKTKSKYDNFCENLETFLKSVHLQASLSRDIDASVIEDFRFWLHKNLSSCGLTHSSKHINRCKKVMDYAITKGYVKYNSISFLKTKRDPLKEVITLEGEEFEKWKRAIWNNLPYQKAQDLYIFQSTAGLGYMDLFTYKTIETPVKTDTGIIYQLWIESKRGKTKKPYYVPLWHEEFKTAFEIHQKYNGKLPFLNNGSYNRYIKEMAEILGISKHKELTTHTGRKNLATYLSGNGWDTGPISEILGNTVKVCDDYYIKTGKKKIEFQLRKLA